MAEGTYRLVTRSDFDGLVCAILLKQIGLVDEIAFVHPKDVQDGKVPITGRDITTNLPYAPDAHLAFDHHLSETMRVQGNPPNHIIDPDAPSAARVVYEHFGGRARFPQVSEAMMAAVDQADSAQYAIEDILRPQGWALLNFIMDARTGLGRFREFRISNYQLMMRLIDDCQGHPIETVLELPDVQERVELYREHEGLAREQIERCAQVHDNLVLLSLQGEETIWAVNRFMVYALFPRCNISMHRMWGREKRNTVFAVGKSILDRSSRTNVGALMLEFGGGGHAAAGTCQVPTEDADEVQRRLVSRITADG